MSNSGITQKCELLLRSLLRITYGAHCLRGLTLYFLWHASVFQCSP